MVDNLLCKCIEFNQFLIKIWQNEDATFVNNGMQKISIYIIHFNVISYL
jgi:hypothetical protein